MICCIHSIAGSTTKTVSLWSNLFKNLISQISWSVYDSTNLELSGQDFSRSWRLSQPKRSFHTVWTAGSCLPPTIVFCTINHDKFNRIKSTSHIFKEVKRRIPSLPNRSVNNKCRVGLGDERGMCDKSFLKTTQIVNSSFSALKLCD